MGKTKTFAYLCLLSSEQNAAVKLEEKKNNENDKQVYTVPGLTEIQLST